MVYKYNSPTAYEHCVAKVGELSSRTKVGNRSVKLFLPVFFICLILLSQHEVIAVDLKGGKLNESVPRSIAEYEEIDLVTLSDNADSAEQLQSFMPTLTRREAETIVNHKSSGGEFKSYAKLQKDAKLSDATIKKVKLFFDNYKRKR